jgi:hypothetical protein
MIMKMVKKVPMAPKMMAYFSSSFIAASLEEKATKIPRISQLQGACDST